MDRIEVSFPAAADAAQGFLDSLRERSAADLASDLAAWQNSSAREQLATLFASIEQMLNTQENSQGEQQDDEDRAKGRQARRHEVRPLALDISPHGFSPQSRKPWTIWTP